MPRQLWQSIGQFLVIFFTDMLVFKDWSAVIEAGVADAIYQPTIKGLLGALAIFGVSKAMLPPPPAGSVTTTVTAPPEEKRP